VKKVCVEGQIWLEKLWARDPLGIPRAWTALIRLRIGSSGGLL
jgi:hypothetical protein